MTRRIKIIMNGARQKQDRGKNGREQEEIRIGMENADVKK